MPMRKGKIILAMDVFATDFGLQLKLVGLLSLWKTARECTVEPVYIMSAKQLRMPPAFFRDHNEKIRAELLKKMNRVLSELPFETEPPTLLSTESGSLRQMAKELLEYAKAKGASLIALTSLSRKGVGRLIWGSFAESLLSQSDVPLLLVTPKTRSISKIGHILFPTDLNPKSEAAFDRVMELARRHNAQLTLFHESEFLSQNIGAAFGSPESYEQAVEDDTARRRQALNTLADKAREAGIKARVELVEGGDIAADIVEFAAKLPAGILAMVSHKEGVEATLPGSVARRVVRRVNCPVWVIHAR